MKNSKNMKVTILKNLLKNLDQYTVVSELSSLEAITIFHNYQMDFYQICVKLMLLSHS